MVVTSFNMFLLTMMIVISSIHAVVSNMDVTVSGISAGAAMAVQLHMAYSKDISGCGVLSGPPFECAVNATRVTTCMKGPVQAISALGTLLKLESYASAGNIDSLSNVENDRVYIFAGSKDTAMLPSIVKLNEKIYSVLGANIKTNYYLQATHGFPTDNFGTNCDVMNMENFINNCHFNMAYDVLNHLHGDGLIAPKTDSPTPLVGQMIAFRQENFRNPPSSLAAGDISSEPILNWISQTMHAYNPTDWVWPTSGLFNFTMPIITEPFRPEHLRSRSFSIGFDEYGFVYFPSACARGQKCSIHVALHGCRQGKWFIGDTFITKTGYLQVAELNNLIILFPQVTPTQTSPVNPFGCWDWWGANSHAYAIKSAPQMFGVKQMIDTVRMISGAISASAL